MKRIIPYTIIFFLYGIMVGNANDPIRIKNFREIYSSYSSITGVEENDSDLQTIFNLVKDRLPKFGIPQEFSNNTVLAMTELSGHFCKKAITREENQTYGERLMFSDIDFTRGPSQFSDYLTGKVGQHLARMFWLRDLKDKELAAINTIITKATSVESEDSIDGTKKVLQILCATYASSMAFLVK